MSKKYAIVKFLSTKDDGYSQGYLYENTVEAKKYDAVIVPTRYGLSLAVVDKLTDSVDSFNNYSGGAIKAIAEIVESKEVAKLMNATKRKDLKKKLDAEVKKFDDVKRFELYAEANPAFAELLEQYKKLV